MRCPTSQALPRFSIIFAAILAVSQDNLKRRLAYSTISQMGYVTLGLALLGSQAATGALVHIANHAFMKGTLFLCAGLLIKRAGIRNVSEMDGVARRMPVTMAAFAVAALAMIGTPPLAGFVSKWYLGLGMLEVGEPLYLIVLLGGRAPGGGLPAADRLRRLLQDAGPRRCRRQCPPRTPSASREGPAPMLVATVIAASMTVLLGVAPPCPVSRSRSPSSRPTRSSTREASSDGVDRAHRLPAATGAARAVAAALRGCS